MAYDPKLGYDPNKDYSLAIVNAGSDEERERQRQAAARSSGPLAGERAEPQPEQEAFRRAFEKALW